MDKIPYKNLLNKVICHRIPERTFKIKNTYFPVCARCTGIYTGAFLYFTFVYFVYIQYSIEAILTAIILIIPTFLDGITQFFDFRESSNTLRFITGFLAGIGLGIFFKAIKWALIAYI